MRLSPSHDTPQTSRPQPSSTLNMLLIEPSASRFRRPWHLLMLCVFTPQLTGWSLRNTGKTVTRQTLPTPFLNERKKSREADKRQIQERFLFVRARKTVHISGEIFSPFLTPWGQVLGLALAKIFEAQSLLAFLQNTCYFDIWKNLGMKWGTQSSPETHPQLRRLDSTSIAFIFSPKFYLFCHEVIRQVAALWHTHVRYTHAVRLGS